MSLLFKNFTFVIRFESISIKKSSVFILTTSLLMLFNQTVFSAEPLKAISDIQGCDDPNVKGFGVLTEQITEEGIKEVKIGLQVTGLAPFSEHAVHIHETAACEPCGNALGHFDPGPGTNSNPDGNHPYHAGDLVNLVVDDQGVGSMQTITTRVTLSEGPLSLFDSDGSAFIVHVDPDTYCPNGVQAGCAGGARAACGIIKVVQQGVQQGSCLVVLDADAVDNGTSTIEQAAQSHGVTADFLINDDNPVESGNPWFRWNQQFPGDIVLLPAGQPGSEGWFFMPENPIGKNGPFLLQDFVDGNVSQSMLDEVENVIPLGNSELQSLVGQTCTAIVYDSDISINVSPVLANLQGGRYGKFSFTVLALNAPGSIPESGSSGSLNDVRVRVEAPLN